MLRLVTFYLIVLIVSLSSCKDKSSAVTDPIESARAEVMKVHDDAMLKMGEIRSLTATLEDKYLLSADSVKAKEIIKYLEDADEGMMQWMSDYAEPENNLSKFYEAEMKKINVVADKIYSSLEKAKSFINE